MLLFWNLCLDVESIIINILITKKNQVKAQWMPFIHQLYLYIFVKCAIRSKDEHVWYHLSWLFPYLILTIFDSNKTCRFSIEENGSYEHSQSGFLLPMTVFLKIAVTDTAYSNSQFPVTMALYNPFLMSGITAVMTCCKPTEYGKDEEILQIQLRSQITWLWVS